MLVERRLFIMRRVFCVAPEYLQQHGRIAHPNDLLNHELCLYSAYPTPLDLSAWLALLPRRSCNALALVRLTGTQPEHDPTAVRSCEYILFSGGFCVCNDPLGSGAAEWPVCRHQIWAREDRKWPAAGTSGS